MRIGTRRIGAHCRPYLIAEIGVNHDGDRARAVELVHAAADAGADAVKVQLFDPERLVGPGAELADYQGRAGETSPLDMLRRLELSLDDVHDVVRHAHDRGVHAIATIFSTDLVHDAAPISFDAFKSASPDIIHRPLLQAMWRTGRPLIVSTGASTISEIDRAVRWLPPLDEDDEARLALLHCVSAYPTPAADAALRAIAALAGHYDLPVGYSDHTSDLDTGALAVAAGACILEKHLTWNRDAPGPDHGASLDFDGFRRYVDAAHRAADMLGSVGKRVLPIECDVRRKSRQSVVTTRDLRAGHVLERADLAVRRPGDGIEPWRLDEIVGTPLRTSVSAGTTLRDQHVELPEPVT